MSSYLVTGGAGFIGSHIVAALARAGARVRVLDDLSTGRHENFGALEVGAVGSGAAVAPLGRLGGTVLRRGQ